MIPNVVLSFFLLFILGDVSGQKKQHQTRIIGGMEALAHDKPFMVALDIMTNDNKRKFCGGSLIDRKHVLTAGHCTFDAKKAIVVIGAHDLESAEKSQQKKAVDAIMTHPGYDGTSYKDDIAILRLKDDVPLSSDVRVVTVADEDVELDTVKGSGEIMGWGRTYMSGMSPTLQTVDVNLMEFKLCKKIVPMMDTSNICSAPLPFAGSCEGDNGGPLIVDDQQVGIISFPFTLCMAAYPTVYVDVRQYYKWIKKTVGHELGADSK